MAKKVEFETLQSPKLAGNKPAASTQRFLDIVEIRDDVVVLKDGTIRAVLLASSVNFSLKSEDEQNAIVAGYVSFLNSFDFPIQIVVQSRSLNIDNYIAKVRNMEKEQTNELLRLQTADYREFINELVNIGQITSKKFYVVVPYNPASDKQKGFFARLRELFFPAPAIALKGSLFVERKKELLRRVDLVSSGLESIGVGTAVLGTQNLIELYYNTYNPVTMENQKMVDVKELRVEEQ